MPPTLLVPMPPAPAPRPPRPRDVIACTPALPAADNTAAARTARRGAFRAAFGQPAPYAYTRSC
jgi:hypothetical protein